MRTEGGTTRFGKLCFCALVVFVIGSLLLVTTEAKTINKDHDSLHIRATVKIIAEVGKQLGPPEILALALTFAIVREWVGRSNIESPALTSVLLASTKADRAPPRFLR